MVPVALFLWGVCTGIWPCHPKYWMTDEIIITRQEAKKLGLKKYRDGRACKHGHRGERYVSCYACLECYGRLDPTQITFNNMLGRCYRPTMHGYKHYGGRHITVCDRWRTPNGVGFRAFVEDMGERPPDHSIDRIDNDGPYSPENCRWSLRRAQQRNRSDTQRVIVDGEEMCLKDAAEKLNIRRTTIHSRMSKTNETAQQSLDHYRKHGLSKAGRPGHRLSVNGVIMSQQGAAEFFGVTAAALRSIAYHRYAGNVQQAVQHYEKFGVKRRR
jgi:hypothetical protein